MQTLKILPDRQYIIQPKSIWDGCMDNLLVRKSILVKDGLIEKIVPAEEATSLLATNSGLSEINLSGLTIIPGFIDCHVHLAFDAENLQLTVGEWTANPVNTWKRISRWMEQLLTTGISAIRDGGDLFQFGLRAREMQKAGKLPGPKIKAPGAAICCKGKYGEFLGPGITCLANAKEQVESLARQKADHLKVVVSGLVSFKEYGQVGSPQFSVEELTPIVSHAHSLGLPVMAHASSDTAVAIAIKAGVDSVEHGYFVKEDTLKEMAESRTAWIPTVAPLGNLLDNNGQPPYPGADLEVIRRTYELQLKTIYKAQEYGVHLGVGTDAGANRVPPGISYFQELHYYLKAGLTPLQVLKAATAASSDVIKIPQLGTLKNGQWPCLIGVSCDPIQTLPTKQDIKFVSYI